MSVVVSTSVGIPVQTFDVVLTGARLTGSTATNSIFLQPAFFRHFQ